MDAGEREMSVNHADIIRISIFDTRHHGRELGAAWSLEIAIFEQGYIRITGTNDPVSLADGRENGLQGRPRCGEGAFNCTAG